jgi:hypothetical protein
MGAAEIQANRIEEKLDALTNSVADVRVKIEGVATKMNFLVGPDGTNGVVGDLIARVDDVEKKQAYFSGVAGIVGAGFGFAFHWLKIKLFGGR